LHLNKNPYHIDGSTPKPERDATLARLASGEIEVVCNCMVLTEGWDTPEVAGCILARPTKKMGLFRQMIGRVLRPAPGKSDAIILDHSGAVYRHGLPEDPVEWTLDVDKRAESEKHKKRGDSDPFGGSGLIECSQCGALRVCGKACPNCGFLPQRPGRDIHIGAGELGLVGRNGKAQSDLDDAAVRTRWHAMLVYIANERGYKPGWISHQYRQKFGVFPAWGSTPEPIEASREVRNWVKSRIIAWKKARRSAA
jgi:DNA repair protein RadD